MMKLFTGATALLLIAAVCAGCHGGSKTTHLSSAALPLAQGPFTDGGGNLLGAVRSSETAPVFTAPIAAIRVGTVVVVAGFVQRDSAVRVVALSEGSTLWSTDAVRAVAWTANAELSIQRAGEGTAVLWRSGLGTAGAGKLVLLGPHGELREAPIDVRAPVCATADGLVWIEPLPRRGARVLARAWGEPGPHSLIELSPDQAPSLVCGDRSVFVLDDRDDALTVTSFVLGDLAARSSDVAIRDADFSDDERDHQVFTVGDVLEIVRVGERGSLVTRDVPSVGKLTPWRKLTHVLTADDDLVALDGNATTTLMVLMHDAEDACPSVGSLAQRVRVLQVDRKSGAESVVELAPTDCTRSLGPFWVAPATEANGDSLVAWIERRRQEDSKAPPISGIGYRRLGETRAGHIEMNSDALVTGGCDRGRCIAAALARAPGQVDPVLPMAIMVLVYP